MMEICTTEHQTTGTILNPNFAKTFELFFESSYRAFTADSNELEIRMRDVYKVMKGTKHFGTHNFVFR